MELKKLVPAVVVGYALLLALGYLIHGVWRSETLMMHKRWVMWVGDLIFTVVFAWVYTRNIENKPWPGQGIRYGVLMTLLAVVPAPAP